MDKGKAIAGPSSMPPRKRPRPDTSCSWIEESDSDDELYMFCPKRTDIYQPIIEIPDDIETEEEDPEEDEAPVEVPLAPTPTEELPRVVPISEHQATIARLDQTERRVAELEAMGMEYHHLLAHAEMRAVEAESRAARAEEHAHQLSGQVTYLDRILGGHTARCRVLETRARDACEELLDIIGGLRRQLRPRHRDSAGPSRP